MFRAFVMMAVLLAQASGQTAGKEKLEFEVASIKPAPPVGFFHGSDSGNGGPGSTDPGMFRCTCTLASLLTKAFGLQRYQFPGQQSVPGDTFTISAAVPDGTTQEQFLIMLQNLLKSRFGLTYHFDKKELQGYQLTVAKSGPKLKESQGQAIASPGDNHEAGGHQFGGHDGASSTRSGLMLTMGGARYRADHQTTAQLAQLLSNQIAKPVEDQTGLKGAYDILLSWSGDTASHDHQASPGGYGGGAGHGDHGGAPAPSGDSQTASDIGSGPSLFEAVQAQLGLKLVSAKKTTAQIFVLDHINKVPTAN